MFFIDLEFIPGSAGSAGSEPFAPVRDLLNTRRSQDDVSSDKLLQNRCTDARTYLYTLHTQGICDGLAEGQHGRNHVVVHDDVNSKAGSPRFHLWSIQGLLTVETTPPDSLIIDDDDDDG